jgi:hypothetical protein
VGKCTISRHRPQKRRTYLRTHPSQTRPISNLAAADKSYLRHHE